MINFLNPRSIIWILLNIIILTYENRIFNLSFEPLSDQLIDYINHHPEAKWKAARTNRFKTIEDAIRLLGSLPEDLDTLQIHDRVVTHENLNLSIPDHFDARDKWPGCPSIKDIRDQSACGSCWAFGAVEAISDRICIHSRGKIKVNISATELLSCCKYCGSGCKGGMVYRAWFYWLENGLVTGGSMESNQGCQPYPFPTCDHHGKRKHPSCPSEDFPTPKCSNVCQKDYKKSFKEDKHFGKEIYTVYPNEKAIMAEIMINGPVEASFNVHVDFLNYKSGIYEHMVGVVLGGHAIRILGWGVENNKPYWLCANSWNEDWGEDGYFRILRGKNECGIESKITAGLPLFQ